VIRVALIAAAGALGALARYGVGVVAGTATGTSFPWTTFAINLAGSFALGLLVAAAPGRWPADVTVAVGVGFLGAFTTFSTFSNETVTLLRGGHVAVAATYVLASMVVGIAAAAAGYGLGRTTV
jgi:CrcB protein